MTTELEEELYKSEGKYPNLTQEQLVSCYKHLTKDVDGGSPDNPSLDVMVDNLREKVSGAADPENNEYLEPLRIFASVREGLMTHVRHPAMAEPLPPLEEVLQACRTMWAMRDTVGKFNRYRRETLEAALFDIEAKLGLDPQLSRPEKEDKQPLPASLVPPAYPPVAEQDWEFLFRNTLADRPPFNGPLTRLLEDFAPPGPEAGEGTRKAIQALVSAHDAIVEHFAERPGLPPKFRKDAPSALPDKNSMAAALTAYEEQIKQYAAPERIRAQKILAGVRSGFGIEPSRAVGS